MEQVTFDQDKFYLGKLCPRGHEFEETGQSLRYKSYEKCVKCNSEKCKAYYGKNREAIKAKSSEWYNDNLKRGRESRRRYEREHRAMARERFELWYEENKDAARAQRKASYEKNKTDPKFRLNLNMGGAMNRGLRSGKMGVHWEDMAPFILSELIPHLESQFTPEMNWDNYGTYWHVDHRIPLSLWDFESPTDPQFKACWSLENLRPLEAKANIRKSNKLELQPPA